MKVAIKKSSMIRQDTNKDSSTECSASETSSQNGEISSNRNFILKTNYFHRLNNQTDQQVPEKKSLFTKIQNPFVA